MFIFLKILFLKKMSLQLNNLSPEIGNHLLNLKGQFLVNHPVKPFQVFSYLSQTLLIQSLLFCLFQDIPTYCITLTLLVLCLDRHQSIRHPDPGPLPMRWILALVWVISVALVLPYMAYITHVDLSVSNLKWDPSVILYETCANILSIDKSRPKNKYTQDIQ